MIGRAQPDLAKSREGFTLVELLVGAALTGIVLTVIVGVVSAVQRGTRRSLEFTDQAMSLRVAINQMGDDLSYTNWTLSCATTPGPCSGVTSHEVICSATRKPQVSLQVYQPVPASAPAAGWQYPGFPGYLNGVPLLEVRYELDGDSLTRQIRDEQGIYAFTHQELAAGLKPCSPGVAGGSELFYSNTDQTVKVRLRPDDAQFGGAGNASAASTVVQGAWFVR